MALPENKIFLKPHSTGAILCLMGGTEAGHMGSQPGSPGKVCRDVRDPADPGSRAGRRLSYELGIAESRRVLRKETPVRCFLKQSKGVLSVKTATKKQWQNQGTAEHTGCSSAIMI